jgi:hypothetical protein
VVEGLDGIGNAGHWSRHARRWADLGAPLKPGPEDIEAVRAAAAELVDGGKASLAVLLLGVTPEIAGLAWPAGAHLTAFDHAFGMVSNVWRGAPPGVESAAAVADWRRLPLAGGSIGLAVGDGSYNSVESIAAQNAVSAEIVRVLQSDGVLALRIYAKPDAPISPGTVIDDLRRGAFGSFSAFKMRLLMAMPAAADGSIRLGDVWDAWAEARVDAAALAAETGWAVASIETIDSYRGKDARYVFLTLGEMRSELSAWFREVRMVTKRYEVGALCPTLVLAPR